MINEQLIKYEEEAYSRKAQNVAAYFVVRTVSHKKMTIFEIWSRMGTRRSHANAEREDRMSGNRRKMKVVLSAFMVAELETGLTFPRFASAYGET